MLQIVANKTKMLTVKMRPELIKEFKTLATARHTTMSAIISLFVAQKVRDEKERNPEIFRKIAESERPVITAKIRRQKGKGKRNQG